MALFSFLFSGVWYFPCASRGLKSPSGLLPEKQDGLAGLENFGLCCLIRSVCAYNSGTGAFLFILKLFSIVPSKTSHSAWVAVYYQYCILSLTCEIKISCCLLWCDPLALVTFLIERSATRNFQTARNRGSTFIIICGKGPIETRRPFSFCGSRLFFFLFSTPTVAQAACLLDFRNTGAQRI